MNATFSLRSFAELSTTELYACLRLRAEVFVVEQDCVYQDLDGLDHESLHLQATDEAGRLLGYARLLPPDLSIAGYCAIGRIVTAPSARRTGVGRPLVWEALKHCARLWPTHQVAIHAQVYLLEFYGGLGFEAYGEEFLEDGIPHMCMRQSLHKPA